MLTTTLPNAGFERFDLQLVPLRAKLLNMIDIFHDAGRGHIYAHGGLYSYRHTRPAAVENTSLAVTSMVHLQLKMGYIEFKYYADAIHSGHRRTGQHPFGGSNRVLPEWRTQIVCSRPNSVGAGVVAEFFRDLLKPTTRWVGGGGSS